MGPVEKEFRLLESYDPEKVCTLLVVWCLCMLVFD
jgi:hypothetical protein